MQNIKITNEDINDRIQLGVTLILIISLIHFILNSMMLAAYSNRFETRFDKIEKIIKIEKPNETISL